MFVVVTEVGLLKSAAGCFTIVVDDLAVVPDVTREESTVQGPSPPYKIDCPVVAPENSVRTVVVKRVNHYSVKLIERALVG